MLVGRESERRLVDRLVAGARLGESGVLVLVGEAGIGKSALLAEAASRAQGMRVLRAAGSELDREVPFGGLLQLLRPVLDRLHRLPAPQAAALEDALALRTGAGGGRFAVGAAVLGMLSRLGEEQPVAVLVDDAHLLDEPSAQALVFAARRLLADPVAVLAAARPGASAVTDGALPVLAVGGLDRVSTRALVAAASGTTPDEALVQRLHAATGGNPLAVVELASDLDTLERLSPEEPLPAPVAVAGAFARRFSTLGPDERTALLVTALAGGDLSVAARACRHLGVDVASLADAERLDLVRIEPGRAELRHPLVRSTVYAEVDPAQRRAAHRAVAEALPADDADRRTWHLAEAAVGPDAEVARRLELLGHRSRARRAHAVATTAHERAAHLSEDPADRGRRLVHAAECAWLAGQDSRADLLAAEALRAGGSPEVLGRAQSLQGNVAARRGFPERARDLLLSAADAVAAHDPAAGAVQLADAVTACYFLGDAAGGLKAARRAERLLRRPLEPRSRAVATMAVGMARVLAGRGGTREVREAVDLLESAADVRDDPSTSPWLLLGPLWLREVGTGRALVDRAVEQVRERVGLGVLPLMLLLVAKDDATTDRWSDAEAGYSEGLRLARETGQNTVVVACLAGSAWLTARQGRDGECRAFVDDALALSESYGLHMFRVWTQFAAGDLELGAGRLDAAAARYRELTATLDRYAITDVDLSAVPELTEALVRQGRRDEAVELVGRYRSRARNKGQPWACARAERAVALLDQGDAEERFRDALALHERTLDAFERARTELAYGEWLRRARRRVDARGLLRAALETFDRLGAEPWAARTELELAATGETARRREVGAEERLTPQERQIAVLLARGSTTRQAAAALFLSPKTVEYHLRHVYTKLGIGSRAELSARLHEPPG